MEAIFPISALQKDASAVRQEAESDIVRLTVDGRGKYIFATEDVFEEYVNRKVEEALYKERLEESLDRATEDERTGRLKPAGASIAYLRKELDARAAS